MKKSFLLIAFAAVSVICFSQPKSNVSKVPKYSFSNDAAQQIKELETNPMMLYYAEMRKEIAEKDTLETRPIYHFTSPEKRLNDPNGLCYWNGYWHLFYQAYPIEDPRQHWGHAISKDLIHWQDLPLAIYPDPEDAVYSGACMVEEDRVIASYYGRTVGEMIAIASDPLLLNWEKIGGAPVIAEPPKDKPAKYLTFDPCIWKKGDYYYLISGRYEFDGPGDRRRPAEFLFRSKDLKTWKYMHQFVEMDQYSMVGDDRACPYFWPIGDKGKYILNHFSHKSGGKYLVGDYDKKKDKFIVTSGGSVNTGAMNPGCMHAPSAYPDGNGGVYVIYNTHSHNPIPEVSTACMTLVYRQTIDDKERIRFAPAGEYESLRYAPVSITDLDIPANEEIVLSSVKGKALELEIEFDEDTPSLEINVLQDPLKEEYTTITFYRDKGIADRTKTGKQNIKDRYSVLEVSSARGSLSPRVTPREPDVKHFPMPADGSLKLHIFIDHSIVEVFANDFSVSMVRTWPIKPDSDGISIRTFGKPAKIKKLNAWKMKAITPDKLPE